jgi:polyisoprenoid-binding protein YceI
MAHFKFNKSASIINWTGKKILGLHTGLISLRSGHLEIDGHQIPSGEIIIDMTSITVTDIDDPKVSTDFRNHLMHDDFFSVDKFPSATLAIENATALGNNQFRIEGLLTIKGISHAVTFTSTVETFSKTLHVLGEMVIDRTNYNIRYGSGKFMDGLGDTLIYDEFVLQFKLIGQEQTNVEVASIPETL